MVMHEMILDMTLSEHRKAILKYEMAFFVLEKGIGEIEKKPDNPEAQHDHHHH